MKKILISFAGLGVAMAFTFAPAVSFAAYTAAGQNASLPAAMAANTNAYLAGGTVDAETPVDGDLTVVGGTVIVSSAVKQDILAAGGTMNIIGASAQDLRVAGGNVTIDGQFSGEVMAAGGNITVTSNATIAKDSYFAAGTLNFMGTENGALTVLGGTLRINGMVNGNLTIPRGGTITIGPSAVIKGNLEYSSQARATIEQGAQIVGQTTFHAIAASAPVNTGGVFAAIIGFWLLAKFFVLLSAAYLLWYFRRKDLTAIIEATHAHFGKQILRGFAFLVLPPVAAIILFMTLIGAIPAVAILLAYILLLVFMVPTAIVVTTSILMVLFKKDKAAIRWYHVLVGALVYELLGFVPFLGWIAGFLICLAALGGLAGVLKTRAV